jgi:DNA invertase Pin-like site-specific DNA recombinase
MTVFGYARVSTSEQTLDAQLEELTAAGASRIFKEKESGAKTDRKELAKAIACLEPGDILLISRLARGDYGGPGFGVDVRAVMF